MQLTRVAIRNFRCIAELEVYPKDFTSLIGPNNSGKSAVLRAIEIALNQETPDDDDWCHGRENDPIVIELDLENLKEWERDTPGVSGLVHDNAIKLRLTVHAKNEQQGKKKVEKLYECKKAKEDIQGWSDSWGTLSQELKGTAGELQINGAAWRNAANRERVRQRLREVNSPLLTVGEVVWTSEGLSIDAALQQALPRAQLIPAVRDASDDGKFGASTSFGQLMRSVIMPAISSCDEFKALLDAVSSLELKLKEGDKQLQVVRNLAKSLSDRLSELIPAKVALGMETPDAEKFVGANTTLRLDDGTATRIGLQGHGLQRALVFAMLEVLATQKATGTAEEGKEPRTRATILLFEEPELFMHPHLMRRLKKTLMEISKRETWQVIVTTHSPFLIDVSDDRGSLVMHRREIGEKSPTVKQLKPHEDPLRGDEKEAERERLRALLDFHPSVCEAFFARNVLLVEGDTEVAALSRRDAFCKLADLDSEVVRDTTIVSCDGKWTIVPIARLLRAFGVPLRVIHDKDQKGKPVHELRNDPSHPYNANDRIGEAAGSENVYVVDDTFEDVLSLPGDEFKSGNDKPYRAWKRVAEICEGRADLSHAPKLTALLKFAYK